MNFSCKQQNISKALNIVSRFSGTKTTTLPILNNILISTDKGRLKFSATNLEIGINTWIGAKVEEEGSYTIPSKLFIDFINTNNDETINFKLKDDSLILKSDKYNGKIKGIVASEFPLIPSIKNKEVFYISAEEFKTAIIETAFACAIDETRPILAGVYMKVEKDMATFVSTDSYRLAEKQVKLNKSIEGEINIIIPSRVLSELARIITNEKEIGILCDDNQIQFNFGEIEVISRLIEGKFPDYKQLIANNFSTEVVIKNNDLKNAIKMASYFVRDGANNIRVKVDAKGMIISSYSAEVGDSESKLNCEVKGVGIEITFNAKYILDALNVIGSDMIEFKFNDKLNPGFISTSEDKNYKYIIMPLRIEE
ncbi:MAG: DNA polymerase III subunit beta [Patescibacteria group bacterium]